MPGKRVQFDPQTWHALDQLAKDRMQDFQELGDEAFTFSRSTVANRGPRPLGFVHPHPPPTDRRASFLRPALRRRSAPAETDSLPPEFRERLVLIRQINRLLYELRRAMAPS
jgi:hypothetical protein